MNILYIAYSCSPNHGSEDRIGWKIPLASAQTNQVYVITKEEHRAVIEEYQKNHVDFNVTFFYIDIPFIWKKVYRGPVYAGRLNIWQKRAVKLAEVLCKNRKIDLIHQITPVEFRSIGDYGKIAGVKYICGPIGGGEFIPEGLQSFAKGHKTEELLRGIANRGSRWILKQKKILDRCDRLLFVNEETEKYLRFRSSPYPCMVETGTDEVEISTKNTKHGEKCIFLLPGRLVYRKGHAFLLEALRQIPANYNYECHFVGSGPETERIREKIGQYSLSDRVFLLGKVGFEEMSALYDRADALIMPSLRETTGSVLLEAMAKGLPVITTNRFGGKVLLKDSAAWFYEGTTREEWIGDLRRCLIDCITSIEKRKEKGACAMTLAQKNRWERKMKDYNAIYEEVLEEKKVSVIVPVYNAEKYLDLCLSSITEQSYRNLEIILIDDGSTDDSIKICSKWKDRDDRVSMIKQENRGAGAARNTGMKMATGTYICFLDSDDYMDKTTIEKCVKAIEGVQADAVVFGSNRVSKDGKVKPIPIEKKKLVYKEKEVQEQLLASFFTGSKGSGVSVWGKLYRLNKIKDIHLSFQSEREIFSEDALFNLSYFSKVSSAIIVPENLLYHLENENSISHSYQEERESKKDIFLQEALKIVEKEQLPMIVSLHIQARYHAYVMNSLKQIIKSKETFKDKADMLEQIYEKETFRNTLSDDVLALEKHSLSVFFKFVRMRYYSFCNLLLWHKTFR